MGTIMDVYQLVRDLIDEAKKEKNLEMVDQLIAIKLALSEMQDENNDLKRRITELEQASITEEDLELQSQGYYIKKSEKEEGKNIKYCAACWQNTKKLMPYIPSIGRAFPSYGSMPSTFKYRVPVIRFFLLEFSPVRQNAIK